MDSMEILGICGSLRKKSYNLAALRAAAEVMPSGMKLTIRRFDDVPLYNADVQDIGFPAPVIAMSEAMKKADGLLFASPEYSYSVPGVLKNLLDWLSRLPEPPFKHKPVALLSATGGPLGGSRSQYELRKILGGMEALVLLRPEVFISMNESRFDREGRLIDENTRKILATQMTAFEAWIRKMSGPARP
jgi:chromate reductase, NAD(P)H dehydrogenase (quinone)